LDNLAQGLQSFDRVLEIDPNDSDALNAKSQVQAAMGRGGNHD
jgi:hypothetical protein